MAAVNTLAYYDTAVKRFDSTGQWSLDGDGLDSSEPFVLKTFGLQAFCRHTV
jgi:hypothetical protein